MQRARRVGLRRAAFVAVVVATMAVTAATASASIATAVTAATATAAPTATTAAALNRTPVADAAPVWRSVAPSIDAGSVVTHPAQAASAAARGSAVQLEAPPRDPTCQPPAGLPATARQVVVVRPAGSYADVDLLVRDDTDTWGCLRRAMPARVGRNGTRTLAHRVSGDGTTPAGLFPLGTMTTPAGVAFQFFGNGADPGVLGSWHQVQAGDCWDATGGDATYNTLTNRPPSSCTGDDEYLANVPGAYSRAALIGANMGPDRSGDEPGEVPRAAAIFLHRFSYDAAGASVATSGCVSLAGPDLDEVLRTLVPGEAWFAIGA